MGKSGKKRKRQRQAAEQEQKSMLMMQHDAEDAESQLSEEILTDEMVQTTLETITLLSQNLEQFQDSRRFKALRRALQPIVSQQLQSYHQGTDFRLKVTQALQKSLWTDALAALDGCRQFHQVPKQGTVQRWVRDCDSAPCKLQLMHAILSTTAPKRDGDKGGSLNQHDPRAILKDLTTGTSNPQGSEADATDSLTILEDWGIDKEKKEDETPLEMTLHSRILYREDAAKRTPPNHFDLLLHTTQPGSIQWDATSPKVRRHEVPFLPSGQAYLLENVLSRHECHQLRSAATKLGYRQDHPVAMDHPTGIDSCEWLVDDSILQVINQRVTPHLPATIAAPNHKNQSIRFASVNPRWRFFRYGQGCVYRPHLDGSWPASRINAKGEYECDTDDGIKSYFTFLIYLNDGFEGGQTRYYLQDPNYAGLVGRGVTPSCGSVMVFAQGNIASLIHEGSAVTKGTKFVVRTDVLYHAPTGEGTAQ
eukprot:Nitzschia sp. Nitz4//scaffold18_size181773//56267//57700//NITZ4_001909-RA/size181773-processed-gene-0.194-mRNA-1//1//CDS//3329539993//4816//frame0